MYEILLDELSTKISLQRIINTLCDFDQNIKLDACLDDQIVMMQTKRTLKNICSYLELKGFHVLGAASFTNEKVRARMECHKLRQYKRN